MLIRLNQDVVTPEGPASSAPAHPTQTIALHWILTGQRGNAPLHHFKTGNRRIAPSYSRKTKKKQSKLILLCDRGNTWNHKCETTAFNESIQSVYLFHYLWPFSISSSLLAWHHEFGHYEVCVSRKVSHLWQLATASSHEQTTKLPIRCNVYKSKWWQCTSDILILSLALQQWDLLEGFSAQTFIRQIHLKIHLTAATCLMLN